jgi:hypothetical protein
MAIARPAGLTSVVGGLAIGILVLIAATWLIVR